MPSDDTTLAYIKDTQIEIFDDAKADLQITLVQIAKEVRLDIGTINAWAQARNTLSLWGLKKLLRYKSLAPFLSRLFAPEGFTLIAIPEGLDHNEIAEGFQDYLSTLRRANHPASPGGEKITEEEAGELSEKIVRLPIAKMAGI